MPRKRRTSRNVNDDAVVIKIDGAGRVEAPEKRVDADRPPESGAGPATYRLTAEQINARGEPPWRVWMIVAAAVVGLVFPWWYGLISFGFDAGRFLGWW